MRIIIKPCATVGGAYMVQTVGRFGKLKTIQIGLTKFEAQSLRRQIQWKTPTTIGVIGR